MAAITVTPGAITATGFTLALSPAVNGLTSSNFVLTNPAGSTITVSSFLTADSGATYTVVCAALTPNAVNSGAITSSGNTYTFTDKIIHDEVYIQAMSTEMNNDSVNLIEDNYYYQAGDAITYPEEVTIKSLSTEVDSEAYFATDLTKEYVNYGIGAGYFVGENYKIQPMQQPDAGISAVTGWDTSTVLTYDELVQAAADSPAAGNAGHIQLTYYNNNSNTHNITVIEVNITDSTTKKIYSFVAL